MASRPSAPQGSRPSRPLVGALRQAAQQVELEAEASIAPDTPQRPPTRPSRSHRRLTNAEPADATDGASNEKDAVEKPPRNASDSGKDAGSTEAVGRPDLHVGDKVTARFGGGETFYPGVIVAVNECEPDHEATYAIDYDDGDKESSVAASLIRSIAGDAVEVLATTAKRMDSLEGDRFDDSDPDKTESCELGSEAHRTPGTSRDIDHRDAGATCESQNDRPGPRREDPPSGQSSRPPDAHAEARCKEESAGQLEERSQGAVPGDRNEANSPHRTRPGRQRGSKGKPLDAFDMLRYSATYLPARPRPIGPLPKGSQQTGSVLKIAQRKSRPSELRAVVRDGGNLFEVDKQGWTALHWAVSEAHLQLVEEILSLEMDKRSGEGDGISTEGAFDTDGGDCPPDTLLANTPDKSSGWTPLHLAAIGGSDAHFSIARLLVQKGADAHVKDSFGDKPGDCVGARGKAARPWLELLLRGHTQGPSPKEVVEERHRRVQSKGRSASSSRSRPLRGRVG